MKLKLLLIPFSVLMSLVLIIWYIYPTIFGEDSSSIKNIKNEISKVENDIDNITKKKSNINKLSQIIESNSELKDFVSSYYSTSRKDEDVINNLNNVAFNEGIYIDDIDLKYLKMESQDDPIKVMSLKPIQPIIKNTDSVSMDNPSDLAGAVDPTTGVVENPNSRINYIGVSLKGFGDYNQIRNFLISVNKIGILNKIQYFKISHEKTGQEEGADPNRLAFELAIGFGYFRESKDQVVDLLSSPTLDLSNLDLSDIEKNKDILVGNYQRSEIGETGLANPFIP